VNRTARIVAVDLGASGGKAFAGEFKDGSFSLREIHRFSHEAVTFHARDRDGRLEERTFWDDVLLYANIVQARMVPLSTRTACRSAGSTPTATTGWTACVTR
jgi:hypothetical protein